MIADIESEDDLFIEKAARRGIFAYVRHGEQPEMEHAIDIVLNRDAEFSRLQGALRTSATIEQAKGILMERHGISRTKRSQSCEAVRGTPIRACSTLPER